MRDVDTDDWCHAGGQLVETGTKPGEVVNCELCGKLVKVASRFGDFGYPAYPRHKKPKTAPTPVNLDK